MRLIDADKLKEELEEKHDKGDDEFDRGYNLGLVTALYFIDDALTVEPEEISRLCETITREMPLLIEAIIKNLPQIIEVATKEQWLREEDQP